MVRKRCLLASIVILLSLTPAMSALAHDDFADVAVVGTVQPAIRVDVSPSTLPLGDTGPDCPAGWVDCDHSDDNTSACGLAATDISYLVQTNRPWQTQVKAIVGSNHTAGTPLDRYGWGFYARPVVYDQCIGGTNLSTSFQTVDSGAKGVSTRQYQFRQTVDYFDDPGNVELFLTVRACTMEQC